MKTAMVSLIAIWKRRRAKICTVRSLMFPIALYEVKIWTHKKRESTFWMFSKCSETSNISIFKELAVSKRLSKGCWKRIIFYLSHIIRKNVENKESLVVIGR